MKNVVSISQDDEALEIASRWVFKIDAGELSASDEAALGAWLDQDESHRDVLTEVAAVWDKTDALARLAELFPHGAEGNHAGRGPWYPTWAQPFAVAAGLAALVISGLLLLIPDGHRVPLTTSAKYATAIGEQKTVLLPDGSEVVLNTNSQLAVTLTPARRLLRLARGEILVRVAEDHARPLSVVAGDRIIQAVGTEFVVEITDNNRVELMVTEGKVVVGIQPSIAAPPVGETEALDSTNLLPLLATLDGNVVAAGESVIMIAAEPVPIREAVSMDEIEAQLSWKDGRLIFRSAPLEKALREVERYTTVEFVFLDESLKTRTLSGRFRVGDVESLLLSLRVNFNVKHDFDGESRVLLSSL